MAEIVGALALSHAPQLMLDPDRWHLINLPRCTEPLSPELRDVSLEVKWERWNRCMAAVEQLRHRLEDLAPDTVIVVGDDQRENMIDDNMPPFTVYIGEEAEASVSLRYLNQPPTENRTRYRVDSALATSILEQLLEAGFDPAYSRATRFVGGLGHAFARVLKFLTPEASYSIVPIMVNTYYPPGPSARRCVQFGRALAAAIAGAPQSRRVVLVASGGLSHTKIEPELDRRVISALERNDAAYLETISRADLFEGTSEILNWVVVAAAANRPATVAEYQPLPRVPTGAGLGAGFAYWS